MQELGAHKALYQQSASVVVMPSIGAEGAKAIAEAMCENSSITDLKIGLLYTAQ